MTSDLAAFASRFSIPADVAHVLPALFARSAQMVGRLPRSLIVEATYHNPALGQYMAECAHRVAAAVKSEG